MKRLHYIAKRYASTDNLIKTACGRKVDPLEATPYKNQTTCSECKMALLHAGSGTKRTMVNGRKRRR